MQMMAAFERKCAGIRVGRVAKRYAAIIHSLALALIIAITTYHSQRGKELYHFDYGTWWSRQIT